MISTGPLTSAVGVGSSVKTIAEPAGAGPASVGLGSADTDGAAEAVGELVALSVIGSVVVVAGVEIVAEGLAGSLGEALAASLGEALAGSLGEALAGSLGEALAGSLAEALGEGLAESVTESVAEGLAESVIEEVDEIAALSVIEADGAEAAAVEEAELSVLSVVEPETVGEPVAATRVVGTEATDAGAVRAVGSAEDALCGAETIVRNVVADI